MSDDTPRDLTGAYERAGRQAAVALRGYCTVVVISEDPLAAANVAIGIARVEAVHRRVVIGDLVGDLQPIQSLVGIDDPHGIYDSFVFGTSLERVIYPVLEQQPQRVPGGTNRRPRMRYSPAADGSVSRPISLPLTLFSCWLRQMMRPSLEKLTPQLDGVLVVGDPDLERLSNAVLLARVPHPAVVPGPAPSPDPADTDEPFWRRHSMLLAIGTLIVLFGIMFGLRLTRADRVAATPDTVTIPDSLARDSVVRKKAVLLPREPG